MSQPEYDIFEDVLDINETLMHAFGSAKKNETTSSLCSRIDINDGYKNQVIDVCNEFVYLFKQLKQHYQTPSNTTPTKKYPEFINFWLQLNLLRRNIPDNYKSKLLEHLKANRKEFEAEIILKDKLIFIEQISFIGMRILYNLYKNYYGTLNEYEYNCTDFFKKFKKSYDKCLRRCYAEGDSKLCDVLQKFRNLYNKERFPRINNCNKNLCPLLPELTKYRPIKLTDSEDSNIGYQLYKELIELIWFQYNMPFQYDGEMKKYYMMSILQQFLQYCYENQKNEKLSLFMKEFIVQYYNNNKGEYDKIFSECKTNGNGKKHCQLYEACEKKFTNDLSTIKADTKKFITQQEEYINSLSALELWIFKAKSMFQDF
ncbi:hypothetical protein PVIIG_05891, partial [Plasmodium vivax India VII]